MRVLHFPTLRTDAAGVVNAMMRHPAYREGHCLVNAIRCHYQPLASP